MHTYAHIHTYKHAHIHTYKHAYRHTYIGHNLGTITNPIKVVAFERTRRKRRRKTKKGKEGKEKEKDFGVLGNTISFMELKYLSGRINSRVGTNRASLGL
jgi:hypothetical protein